MDRHEERAPQQVVPPDGGWGWLVVLASLLSTTIIFLSRASFSILYMEWAEYFRTDKGHTGWIGSFFLSTGSLVGTVTRS